MKTAHQIAFATLLLATICSQAATVQQFQPQGKIAEQNRATVRFSADMVKLGEADAPAPFTIDCKGIAGEGRWTDSRGWAGSTPM